MRLELPYGRVPYPVEVPAAARVLHAASMPAPGPLDELLDAALDLPIGGPPLAAGRVTVIVSDPSRAEPRAAFLRALRRRLPASQWTIAIATGTHGACRLDELGIPGELLRDACIVNHDGHADCVELGATSRGTPVRVHRCVLEADLVVATGCVRPHYFAGFGAGTKAIFPGLGEERAIRINHRLKLDPHARAGIVDGNPCREDLEEAAALVPTPAFLFDAVVGPDDRIHAAVAGDVVRAFRRAVELCRPWFTVSAPPAHVVVASDALPVSASLYQAAKIAAAAAPLVAAHGVLVVVAECADGIEPLSVVNEAIFRIGVLPRLAAGVRLVLVSGLPAADVGRTLLEPAASVEAVLARELERPVLVIPRASHLICEAAS